MTDTYKLVYTFKKEDESTLKHTINRVKPVITASEASEFADLVVASDIFSPELIDSKVESVAKIEHITTSTKNYELVTE